MDAYIEFEGQRIRCIDKQEVFGPAEEWLQKNRELFAKVRGKKYLLINVADFTHVIDDDYKAAHAQYKAWQGPTPITGRSFLGVMLPLPR